MNRAGLLPALLVMAAAAARHVASSARGRGATAARLRREAPPDQVRPRQVGRIGGRLSAPGWIGPALVQAGSGIDAGRAWSLWLGTLALAGAAGWIIGGFGAALLAGGAALAGPLLAWRLLRRRADDLLETALPGAVDAIARALRSGASLRQALAEAATATPGPLGEELSSVVRATDRGASVVAALEAWGERQPTAGVRLVVSALCLGAETGGALARAVDGVAATLRQRLAARAEARALATQARASAAVLAAAPLAFTAVTSVVDARTSSFLFRTPTGLLCLAGGLLLDAAAALWMARLTRIEVGS